MDCNIINTVFNVIHIEENQIRFSIACGVRNFYQEPFKKDKFRFSIIITYLVCIFSFCFYLFVKYSLKFISE